MATLGVSITTGSIGPTATPTIGYSNLYAVVVSPWGIDSKWVMCASFAQYVRNFGGITKLASLAADGTADTYSYETTAAVVQGYYAVKAYFDEKANNPNGVAFICRVVKSSSGATAATRNFNDGGANNTVVTAKWKGIMGSAVEVQITASPNGATYKQFQFRQAKANITETWQISNATEAADVSRRSELVTIALPAGGQLPVAVTWAKLGNSPGTAGTVDAYDATDADVVGTDNGLGTQTGLQVFNDARLGSGFVILPGKYSSTIRTGQKTHCETYYRMGLTGTASGLTASTVTGANAGSGNLGSPAAASNFMAMFWPNVCVTDENSQSAGTILVDPVGHIAGLGAKMDAQYRGPHKSPAGTLHPLLTAVDIERTSAGSELANDAVSNTLADSLINTIRIKGTPPRIAVWGLQTLAVDRRYAQINVARVVGLVYLTSYLIIEPFTFEPIDPDGNLYARIKSDLNAFLFGLRREGVLYGQYPGSEPSPKDAYQVICDRGNNPDISVGQGEIHVDLLIVPTPNAQTIKVNLLVAAPGFARGATT